MNPVSLPPVGRVVNALRQFSSYGVPPPGAARLLDVGSSRFLEYFGGEVLDQFVCRGGATCKVLEGAYGSGKTHLLQLLEDLALERGMAVVRTDLSQALSLEDWNLVVKHLLANIEVSTRSGVARSLPDVLSALARDGRLKPSLPRLATLPHGGFAHAIALLAGGASLSPSATESVSRFLVGEKVTVAELRSRGVTNVKHPLSARNAELVLKTVLGALFQLGIPGTLLLFDENEKTFVFNRQVPPRRVVMGANLLRRLIDASASGSLVATAAVFAVLPGFVENCALAYAALGQRLQVNRFGDEQAGWRSPVLSLQAVTTEQDPEGFLEGLLDRLELLLRHCGVSGDGYRPAFHTAGCDVLARNAGSGYRRDLVKRLATLANARLS